MIRIRDPARLEYQRGLNRRASSLLHRLVAESLDTQETGMPIMNEAMRDAILHGAGVNRTAIMEESLAQTHVPHAVFWFRRCPCEQDYMPRDTILIRFLGDEDDGSGSFFAAARFRDPKYW